MLTAIILNIPFFIFFLYALSVCRAKQEIAAQPATAAFYLYAGFLAHLVLVFLIGFLLGRKIDLNYFFQFFAVVHMLLYASLLACVFAWRNTPEASYKRPAILAGIAIGLEIAVFLFNLWIKHMLQDGGYHGTMENLMTISGLMNTVLNLASYIFVLTALFDARGYPRTGPDPIAASLGIPSGSDASTPVTAAGVAAAETTGMFEEQDFIPYVCGTMILGGLLIVPVVWGQITHLDYAQALFPSLLSCGVFAFSHDKRGNFLWGRFIVLMLFIVMTVLRAMAQSGPGSGQPMFMAGGVLGYLVMFGCGWAGIALARLVRGKFAEE